MAKLNTKKPSLTTHEGGVAKHINQELQLRRAVMACLLWENSFYESGVDIAERIKTLVHANKPEFVADLAIDAREKMKLRHIPLFLMRELCRHKDKDKVNVSRTLARVIQRADELAEFLAIYWKDKRQPLSGQVKKGLAKAFTKFSEYDLAKYNGDGSIKLRDVMFLSHPKPLDKEQAKVWKRLVNKTLKVPDTWEVALSSGADKKETWERLLSENKLGALALLRNLRNMEQVSVNDKLISKALKEIKVEKVLPFRFITSARYAPRFESELEDAMFKCLRTQEKLPGKTILVVDVSGSMERDLSERGETTRMDAACGLGILLREICEKVSIYSFSNKCVLVPARRGFALKDAIINSQIHSSTYLGKAIKSIDESYDRMIVITDEQSADSVPNPTGTGYIINVAPYKNGVGYGPWLHVDGFSEKVIDYIQEIELVIDRGYM